MHIRAAGDVQKRVRGGDQTVRKLPKGLLVKMVRNRLENEVMLIMMMSMIITRISMLVVLMGKLRGSPSWSAQHSWMVSMRLENKERMMLVVVGGLLGKDESESIS